MSISTLGKLIVIVISLVAILSVILVAYTTYDSAPLKECMLALQASSLARAGIDKLPGNALRDAVNIDVSCQPVLLQLPNYKSADEVGVMHEVAELVARSWFVSLEGRYVNLWGDSSTNSKFCNPFFIFSLNKGKNFPEGSIITEQQLYLYLRDTEYEKGQRYLDYIQLTDEIHTGGAVVIKGGLKTGEIYGVFLQSPDEPEHGVNTVIIAPFDSTWQEGQACNVDPELSRGVKFR